MWNIIELMFFVFKELLFFHGLNLTHNIYGTYTYISYRIYNCRYSFHYQHMNQPWQGCKTENILKIVFSGDAPPSLITDFVGSSIPRDSQCRFQCLLVWLTAVTKWILIWRTYRANFVCEWNTFLKHKKNITSNFGYRYQRKGNYRVEKSAVMCVSVWWEPAVT